MFCGVFSGFSTNVRVFTHFHQNVFCRILFKFDFYQIDNDLPSAK